MGKILSPLALEWHDNENEVSEGDLVDISPIMKAQTKVATVRTSKGTLILKKMSEPKRRAIASKFAKILTELSRMQGKATQLLEKPTEEMSIEELAWMGEFNYIGRPYTEALAHGSILKPVMDGEIFSDFLASLDEIERESLMLAIANMYAPSEEELSVAKKVVRISKEYGISPFPDVKSSEDLTPDQLQVLSEASQDEAREIAQRFK